MVGEKTTSSLKSNSSLNALFANHKEPNDKAHQIIRFPINLRFGLIAPSPEI